MNDYYARLKPFDPRREHAMRVFVLGHLRFDAGTWVGVDKTTADALRRVHQSYYDSLSPLAFDVCLRSEWEALQVNELPAQPSSNEGLAPDGEMKGAPPPGRSTRKAREA